ncbi:MAG: ATP cone domain-containing protein, partial [Pirellulaceae bacterium]|nr:ATP cone domain-containing protein [Pirellulaceae bacterium]
MLEVSKGNSSVSSSTGDNAVQMLVQKRDGRLVPLHGELISAAMGKAFCAESGLIDVSELELDLQEKIQAMTSEVVSKVEKSAATESGVDVEVVQDEVERELMRHEFFSVARR